MLREIRGVQQRDPAEVKRWFQDSEFDLFLMEERDGALRWFQLCYARDTARERVLEWRRGRGFGHMRVKQPRFAADREAGVLENDGVLPYTALMEQFRASAAGLPPELAAFIAEKIREYARPDRRFPRKGSVTPRWLKRLRTHAL